MKFLGFGARIRAILLGLPILFLIDSLSAQGFENDRTAAPSFGFTVLSRNHPRILVRDKLVRVPLRLHNDGIETWQTEAGYRLSYRWFRLTGEKLESDGLRTYVPGPVDAGTGIELEAWLKAPPAPGFYRLRWQMIEDIDGLAHEATFPEGSAAVAVLPAVEHLLVLATLVVTALGALLWRSMPHGFSLSALLQTRPRLSLGLVALGAFALKIPLLLAREFPTVFGDEALYAFKARNFFTYGNYYAPPETPDVYNLAAPLYSVILAPSFLFSSVPLITYQTMLLINALLLASMVYPAYKIAEVEFPEKKWLVAVAVGIWTTPFCYSFAVMSEAVYTPLFIWAGYFYRLCCESPKLRNTLTFGCVVAALVLSRNAGMAMIGVVVLLMIWSRSGGSLRLATPHEIFTRLPMLVPAVVGLGVWKWAQALHPGGPRQSASRMAEKGGGLMLLDFPESLYEYGKICLAQLSYVNLASFNLFTVLLFFVLWSFRRNRTFAGAPGESEEASRRLLGVKSYFFLSCLAMFFMSTTYMFMLRYNIRGRYVDMLVPVVVIYSIGLLRSLPCEAWRRSVLLGIPPILFLVASYYTISFDIGDVRVINIGAAWYDALRRLSGMSRTEASFAAAGLLVLPILGIMAKRSRVLIVVVFIGLNCYNSMIVFREHQRYAKRDAGTVLALEKIRSSGGQLLLIKDETPRFLVLKAKYYLYQRARVQERIRTPGSRDFVAYQGDILPVDEFLEQNPEYGSQKE